ncbi:MAG: hypothetical protein GY862_16320 [Gammaproteobacteria bacterium]|nr:hypothetical protein [Gammaproteobacteria bacterium]
MMKESKRSVWMKRAAMFFIGLFMRTLVKSEVLRKIDDTVRDISKSPGSSEEKLQMVQETISESKRNLKDAFGNELKNTGNHLINFAIEQSVAKLKLSDESEHRDG